MFSGRLAELQFAEWLETQGWVVADLEAWRKGPDVEAMSADGKTKVAFEVKLIGIEDDDFAAVADSLANKTSVRCVSPYEAVNYLLLRAYEAAKQLEHDSHKRIAVVVIENLTWDGFDLQLDDEWVDWPQPRFFEGRGKVGPKWMDLIAKQKKRHHNFPGDFGRTLDVLDELRIMTRSDGYELHPRYTVFNPGSETDCSHIRF